MIANVFPQSVVALYFLNGIFLGEKVCVFSLIFVLIFRGIEEVRGIERKTSV